MTINPKTLAGVFMRHWTRERGSWRLADNASSDLRTFLANLPAKYTADGVHAALDALANGRPFPDVTQADLCSWVAQPGADAYCQQVFANKKQAPTSFDDLLSKAHKAYQSDLVQFVHTFLAKQLGRG